MKIVFHPFISSYSKYHFTASRENKSVKENVNNNKFRNNSLIIAGALCLAGVGIYISKRRPPVKNPVIKPQEIHNAPKIQPKPEIKITKLPDEKLAKSLPQELVAKLSVGNNYEKFKQLLLTPDSTKIAGSGANSVVYNIDFLDDYVLKVLNSNKKADPNRIPIGLFPENINLGQPVWEHPDKKGILILKKVSGEPNSIKNWSCTIFDENVKLPRSVTQEQANEYFDKISKISQMDQEVFDDLANQIKVLDVTSKYHGDVTPGFKTDSVNPNNLLVDFEKNKLGIIDYFAKDNAVYQNSYMDMVAVISDFTLYPEYYDHLNTEQQKKLIQYLKTIENKSFKAAKKVGLSTDKNVFLNFINKMNKYFPIPSVKKSETEEYIRSYDVRAKALVEMFNNQ